MNRMKWAKRTLFAFIVFLAIAVGHNTNVYNGTDQWFGITWGNVGGCEIGPNAVTYLPFTTIVIIPDAGCWKGISD